MSIRQPFLINSTIKVDPHLDHRWMPDGENMWFLPCVLDLVNQTYSGWWYGSETSYESPHYHTGIAQGTIIRGEMQLICHEQSIKLTQNEGFLLPPHTLHSADMIVGKHGFLIFATICGATHYTTGNAAFDTANYLDNVQKFYHKHNIDLHHVAVNYK